jgi:imidazolonepropionase-like amidohydrolase
LQLGATSAVSTGLWIYRPGSALSDPARWNPAGSSIPGTSAPIDTILTNAFLIDSVRPDPIAGATVFVREGRIKRVSTVPPTRSERQDVRVIDLGGAWLLPGLCEAHSHLISPLQSGAGETPIDSYLRMGQAAMDALKVGITSLRVVGAPGFADVSWRKAFSAGTFLGPRLFVAGHTIITTSGHGSAYNYGQNTAADGPEGLRRAVREQIQGDVDLIKITLTGGVFGLRWDSLDKTQFLPDEIEAAFQTALQRGYIVAAHAGNPEAVKMAVRAGAHSVEHGYVLDEEAISLMKQRNVIYVPTLCVPSLVEEAAESPYEKAYVKRYPLPMNLRERANQRRPVHVQAFKAALDAGVQIASGADQSPPVETAFLEIELLVRYGMKPMQAIIAATRTSARAAGADKEIGTVEEGKLADLLVVKASPLDSIFNLRQTVLVFKGGEVVVDRRS